MTNAVSEMEQLTDSVHSEQKRQDGTTNALHVRRVRTILVSALENCGEAPPTIDALACAALGHDLLEDTEVKEDEIERIAGTRALAWIKGMTNTWGDSHADPYVEQILAAPEEVRLIKLADLCDNIMHASYGARGLGKEWMNSFFLPIVDPMRTAVSITTFDMYPKTARFLINIAAVARTHLEESTAML